MIQKIMIKGDVFMAIDYGLFDNIRDNDIKIMISTIEQVTKRKPLTQAQNYVDKFAQGGLEFLKFFNGNSAKRYMVDYEKYVDLKKKGQKALAREREFVADFKKRTEMAVRFCDAFSEVISGIKSIGNILRVSVETIGAVRDGGHGIGDLTEICDFLLGELEIDKLFK